MAITKEELEELISVDADAEKISSISPDGMGFVTRIPKEIVQEGKISKGMKIRWMVKGNKVNMELIK